MKKSNLFLIIPFTLTAVILFMTVYYKDKHLNFFSRAAYQKANLVIDTNQVIGKLQYNWKALAQGGEEGGGVRMLENVIPAISELEPRYIRLDHIYDFYSIVSRNEKKELVFNWEKFDATICDVYHTGAKPFLVLGYMPEVLSGDTTLVSKPKLWEEWQLTVQKTVERYSGKDTRLCGGVTGDWFKDVYYEVWNEPDLETFGKWGLSGDKNYFSLYYYSAKGAENAQNVNSYFLGGPVVTKAGYWNSKWFTGLINYVRTNNLRLDFISWHHYSKAPDDYTYDVKNVKSWLSNFEPRYSKLPLIISEWGYNSDPDPIAMTAVGAAHTVMTIRHLIEENLEMAFAFDIKDGPEPRWGILTHEGEKKPRYQALKLLNSLEGYRLNVLGEGSFVNALASRWLNKTSVVLVNYDPNQKNTEAVPLSITNLPSGIYELTQIDLAGQTSTESTEVESTLQKTILMPPNSVVSLEIIKK